MAAAMQSGSRRQLHAAVAQLLQAGVLCFMACTIRTGVHFNVCLSSIHFNKAWQKACSDHSLAWAKPDDAMLVFSPSSSLSSRTLLAKLRTPQLRQQVELSMRLNWSAYRFGRIQ